MKRSTVNKSMHLRPDSCNVYICTHGKIKGPNELEYTRADMTSHEDIFIHVVGKWKKAIP